MKTIVGVRFRKPGKVYFFDPGYIQLNLKDKVVVETTMGEDVGEVVINKRQIPDDKVSTELKRIVRLANNRDLKRVEDNKIKEQKAMKVCKEKIKKHKLDMNLVDVEYKFDNSKIIFYFTADGRVDFRELVKDLAAIYKTRIELRQIGVRDEVRKIGLELGIDEDLIFRHPFPGPGLGIRVIGEVTKEKCDILREADAIYMDILKEHGLYKEIWQAFATLPDVKTVGVMGDERTYAYLVGIRAVTSSDGMTSDWYKMPYDVLEKISNRIVNEVDGANRVVYDITSKPPGTIEWE